jgi:hypothetical protein
MSDFKLQRYSLVPPFQIIRRFGFLFLNKRFDFSKYIPFVMYQEINVFRKTKTTSNLKQMDICLFFQLWEHWTQTSLGSMTGYLFICNLLIIVGLILLGEPTSEFLGSRVHLFVIVFSPYKWSHCSAAEELVILLCAGQFGSLSKQRYIYLCSCCNWCVTVFQWTILVFKFVGTSCPQWNVWPYAVLAKPWQAPCPTNIEIQAN